MRINRRVVDAKGRNVGNIYSRLEEARKKRAEILGVRTPANDAAPAPAKKPLVKFQPKRIKVTAKDLLPPINPPIVEAKSPERAKRGANWLLTLMGAAMAGLLAYALVPPSAPTVTSDILTAPTPVLSSTKTSLVIWRDAEPRRQQAAPVRANPTTFQRPIAEPSGQKPILGAFQMIALLAPSDTQRPSPRFVVDPANHSTNQPDALPVPATADAAPIVALDEPSLSISLNVTSQTPRSVLAALRSNAENLGIDIGDPRTVNFPVKSTHVRYFHATDKNDANDLAAGIGANLRDFTTFTPQPPKGYVELWVAGRASNAPNEKTSSLRRDIRQMSANIRSALRSISR